MMRFLMMISLLLITNFANAFDIYGFIPWRFHTVEGKTYNIDVNANLQHLGVKPVRVIYPRYFLTKDERPDPEKIKRLAQSTVNDQTPISFDIEIGNRFRPETNLPIILETLTLYRKFGGQAPVGIYAVLPQNTYGGNRLNPLKAVLYQKLNQQYKAVADLVDFISPSLYNYDGQDLEAWKKSALFSMQESKKFAKGKPIIPYITATYSKTGKEINKFSLTEEEMQSRLDYLKSLGAKGVIVWQSSGERDVNGKFPSTNFEKGWGKALLKTASH